jgi:MinD superfamily P-loop ATPase
MTIAIASGKGGTGKTFVSVNLFFSLSEEGRNVVLADCDAEAPNAAGFFDTQVLSATHIFQMVPVINEQACTWCGRCQEYCAYHAIFLVASMEVIRVQEDLCHGCGACLLACEDGAITEDKRSVGTVTQFNVPGHGVLTEARMQTGVMSPVPVIKAAITRARSLPGTLILDAPPGTSCPFIHTVAAADYVVLVTEPTPFGLSDLKQSLEVLKQLNKPAGVVINRSGTKDREMQAFLLQEHIPLLLDIPFERSIARDHSRGRLVAAGRADLQENFNGMYRKIRQYVGNGSHQR